VSSADPARPKVALAISGHGFGHAVRMAEVAGALLAEGASVVVRTDAPERLFPDGCRRLPSPGWPLDVGVVQAHGLELDIDATRERWTLFASELDARAEVEGGLLRSEQVDLLLGDIPPLGFAAAARAGIPSLGIANFGWDWIYDCWPDFEAIVSKVRTQYALAEGLLRLPLHGSDPDAFPAFRVIDDVPLIGRHAQRSRAAVRCDLGLPADARVVLVSFGGFTARGFDVSALERWHDYSFVLTPPLSLDIEHPPANVLPLPVPPLDYVSLVAACDVVVTKPGYGIVADCLSNRVAMLFTDRGPFREYEVLAEALPRLGHARYISSSELLAGHLGPHLDRLLTVDETTNGWTDEPTSGAQVIARKAIQRCDRLTTEQNG
jgi:L-arabinokinase